MYLARLRLNSSRLALGWVANPYRVHQRLQMAYEGDQRLLWRLEETPEGAQIIAQSYAEPQLEVAFADFAVLRGAPECKAFALRPTAGQTLAFRLRANPTKKVPDNKVGKPNGRRVGLYKEEEQIAWLGRKAEAGGFRLLHVQVRSDGLAQSTKRGDGEGGRRTLQLLAVTFEGVLVVTDPARFVQTVEAGIGSGKGLGFGLLSLARAT